MHSHSRRSQWRSSSLPRKRKLFVEQLESRRVMAAVRALPGFLTTALAANDDSSVGPVSLGFTGPINYFGTSSSTAYVNNNGNVTFDSALSTYTPFPLSNTNRKILAPFFADVMTFGNRTVRYGNDIVDGRKAFGVVWPSVGFYSADTRRNIFELVIIERFDTGAGNFDVEFNYDQIRWETGDSSGGTNGLGGNSARVGFASGTNGPFREFVGSAVNGALLDSNTTTGLIHNRYRSSQDGRYVLTVRGGAVVDPDLQVENVQVTNLPAISGGTMNVRWTVKNSGNDPTPNGWSDRVRVVNRASGAVVADQLIIYDPLAAGNGSINPGTSRTRNTSFTLPDGPTGVGVFDITITTDALQQIFEANVTNTSESNNSATANFTSTLAPYANLDARIQGVPTGIDALQSFSMTFDVSNSGNKLADGTWLDRVYLSTTPTVTTSSQLLHEVTALSPLATGASYRHTLNVIAPQVAEGNYFIVAVSNANNAIFEVDRTNNVASTAITIFRPDLKPRIELSSGSTPIANGTGSLDFGVTALNQPITKSVTIRNAGPTPLALGTVVVPVNSGFSIAAQPPSSIASGAQASFQIRFDATTVGDRSAVVSIPNNDPTKNPFTFNVSAFAYDRVDLVVSDIQVDTSTNIGGSVDLNWQVTNRGSGEYRGAFSDRVWISLDAQIGNDRFISDYAFTGTLLPGQSTTRTQRITLPSDLTGKVSFVVKTDALLQVVETDENNNTSIDDRPLDILAPDLKVYDVQVASTIPTGTQTQVNWKVRNAGSTSTPSGATWSDRVYLSTDSLLDAGDLRLASLSNPQALAVNESYTSSVNVAIPYGTYGVHYLIIETDSSAQVLELDERNNVTASSASNIVWQPPDLRVTNVVSQFFAFAGTPTHVSWEVRNFGLTSMLPSEASWSDRVWLSTNTTLAGAIVSLGEFRHTGILRPREGYSQSLDITLPPASALPAGMYYVVVETDSRKEVKEGPFEGNNETAETSTIQVVHTPPPDLIVESISASAATLFAGQSLNTVFRVKNAGAGNTEPRNTQWSDRVYLSRDESLDSTDQSLSLLVHNGGLSAGGAYDVTASLPIPNDAVGDYYLIVVANALGQVFGDDLSNNALASRSKISIQKPPADLSVVSVQSVQNVVAGSPLTVDYVVQNIGPQATTVSTWIDRLYLSRDLVIGPDDTRLMEATHTGSLGAGAQYSNSITQTVNQTGTYYLLVETDSSDAVLEIYADNNVQSAVRPINVVPPPANLTTSKVTVPATVSPGRVVPVSYRVSNTGPSATLGTNWLDRIYLSRDQSLDSNDIWLSTVSHTGALQAAPDFYDVTASVLIPQNLNGPFFIIVQADYTDAIYELNKIDNIASTPVTLATQTPDLIVESVTASANAESNSALRVDWIVKNQGSGDTIVSSWRERVYLSSDANFTPAVDPLLSELVVTNVNGGAAGPLAAAESARRSQVVTLPNILGDYYLFVFVDATNLVFEGANEGNNTSIALPITINSRDVDLQVTSVTAASSATEGVPFNATWTVKNAGTVSTQASFWYDDVYLSSDNQLSTSDIRLGSFRRTNALGAGEAYSATASLTIPLGVVLDSSTPYYLLLKTDGGDKPLVAETSKVNNVGATVDTILVQKGTAPTQPNLQVSSVVAPTVARSGAPVTVSWNVKNNGQGGITNGNWNDAIYLSLDKVLDRQPGNNRDIYLGYRQQLRSLASGDSYSESATLNLPSGLAGDYYVLTVTDSGGVITEGAAGESDNVLTSDEAIKISPRPPADLIVGTMTIPANGVVGRNATITYTVSNVGANPALGSWYDSLYLSADNAWNVDDPLFSRVLHTGDLQPGTSYSQSVTATLPGLLPGQYYVIVRSDILNQIVESNEANNISASLDSTSLDVESLTAGSPTNGILSEGQAFYYKVTVPAGETLVVELNAQNAVGVTELHVSSGTLPTRTRADFSDVENLVTDRRLVVESTTGQTYYILAYGSRLNRPTTFSLTARTVQFEVFNTNFGQGGNTGERTIAIEGTKLNGSLTAVLMRNGVVVSQSTRLTLEGSTHAYATFDLRNVPVGKYDVRLTVDGVSPITVNNGFEVVAGTAGHLVYRTNGAERSVRRTQVSYDLIIANDGLNDAVIPLLRLTSDNAAFQLTRELRSASSTKSIDFLPIARNGDRSILRPGEQIIVPFSAVANSLGSTNFKIFDFPDTNRMDVSQVRETIFTQLAGQGTNDLNAQWSGITSAIGSTVGDLRRSLLTVQPFGEGADSFIPVREFFQSLLVSGFFVDAGGLVSSEPGENAGPPRGGLTVRSARTPSKPAGFIVNFNPINFAGNVDRNRIIDPSLPTAFIIHGYTDNGGNAANNYELPEWIHDNALALRSGNGFIDGSVANIIVVDWSDGAGADSVSFNPFNYLHARQHTEVMGETIAAYMKLFGIRPEDTTLIGHSLGAQSAGDAGEAVQVLFQGRQIKTIIALDEAGPLYEGSINSQRLDASDAIQVTSLKSSKKLGNDVHTADGSIYFNACFDEDGHVTEYNHGYPYLSFLDDHSFGREKILPDLLRGKPIKDLDTGRMLHYSDLLTLSGATTWVTNPNLACEDEGTLDPDLGDPGDEDWQWTTTIVQSLDPNDIVGPQGFGPEHWVAATQPLDYMIRFENDPAFATAAAQQIRISQTLDSDLDYRTFRLGDFGIGDLVVDVPENRSYYATRLDLRETKGIYVDVLAGINVSTGEAFWNFTAIDPATGEQPADPLLGLLPPNINPPEGDGFVRYTIRAKAGAVTGTRIDAKARIVFDINEPIDTPAIFNTLDAVAPTSQVHALDAELVTYQGRFPVSWSGSDDAGGSALRSFDIYVRVDDGPIQKWLSDVSFTSAMYDGPVGRSYAFYSVARDNVELAETVPTAFDAQIRVVAPLDVAVSINGELLPNATGTIHFGSAIVGTEAPTKVLTIRNSGQQPLVLGSASLASNNAFRLLTNLDNGLVLQPGATTTLTLAMNATQPGEQTAALSFSTNVPGKDPFTLVLRGVVQPVPALSLSLESESISEDGSFIIGVVSRNTAVDTDLIVNLSTRDATDGTVPATVTIRAGATSASFRFSPINNSLADGNRDIVITATAAGVITASAIARVTDDEIAILQLTSTASTLRERDGKISFTVTRNSPTTRPLTVGLSSSDPLQATVGESLVIPAGQTSASFEVTAVPDGLVDGDHLIELMVTSPGFVAGRSELTITDDDVPTIQLRLSASTVRENDGSIRGTLSRNTPTRDPLVVQLTSNDPLAATIPSTVTIAPGASSASFDITIVNDVRYRGDVTARITAAAGGFPESSADLRILEDDPNRPWHNSLNPLDVNADGAVTPIDALLIINLLNSNIRVLPDPSAGQAPPPFVDVNQDGSVTPIDALLVINRLNNPSNAEGEPMAPAAMESSVFGDTDWLDSVTQGINKRRRGL